MVPIADPTREILAGIEASFGAAMPIEKRLALKAQYPDAEHPDTWIRIFMNGNGAINYLKCSDPQADADMDKGLESITKADVEKYYGEAGDLIAASGCFITLADNREIVVARKGLTGFVHQLPTAYTIRLKDLKEG